jgi:hypothetical protein
MSITLTCTWNPRGETSRLLGIYPQLIELYSRIIIVIPPVADQAPVEPLKSLAMVSLETSPDWSWGRYLTLRKALETNTTHIHYADMDRLVRWVETQPQEWRQTLEFIQQCDCVVIGRTEQAWETHPQALRKTEEISNQVFSYLLGQPLDLSAGSKGFSRLAVEFILAQRGGFRIDSLLVDGLDWESADRYQDEAAGKLAQHHAASVYDSEAENWELRVKIALEIVESGLEALQRNLK